MRFLFLSIFMQGLVFGVQAQKNDLKADLQLLNQWFAGEFNNYQQVHKEKEDSVAIEMRHEHIHSIFKPVSLSWLGQSVYFVKQYFDNDPNKVYRQRIYHFHLNEQEKAIQLDIYSFQNKEQELLYGQAHLDPSVLSTLNKEQLSLSPGCEVFWKRDGDHFIGYMKNKACNFISRRSNKRIFITDSLTLNKDEIWIRDEAEDEDGNYVFGHKGKIPHKLKRCHFYTAWAAAPPPGASNMEAIRGLRLHNQGDKQVIKFANGQPTGYTLRLGQLIYGTGLEVLQLALFKDGEEKPITYTWTSPDSERIGLNILGLFQTGFTKVK